MNIPELKEIADKSHRKKLLSFRSGEYLFKENSEARSIFFIKTGSIKITKKNKPDRNIILHIAGSGDALGIHAVVNKQPYTNSAAALSRATVYAIPAGEFLDLLNKDIKLKISVMRLLCSRIDLLEDKLSSRSEKSAGERLAETLVNLTKTYGTDTNDCIDLDLSLPELADIIGTSREYLNKKMLEFNKSGLISTKSGKIKILDPGGLEKIGRR